MADNSTTTTTSEVAPGENPKPKAKKAAAPATPPLNVYTKLLDARMKFLEAGVKKSGINRHLEFCYFELEDIVPVATPIFAEVGLLPMVNFPGNEAVMTIINVVNPEEVLIFRCDMPKLEPNKGTNPVQAMGAAQTYMRRYLYMMALDIVEADSMDANAGNPTATVAAPKPPAPPPTAAQREEIKDDLTNGDAPADDIQIQQLKKGLERLRELDPSKEEAIQQIAVQTDGFTHVSRKDCADLLIAVGELIATAERGS